MAGGREQAQGVDAAGQEDGDEDALVGRGGRGGGDALLEGARRERPAAVDGHARRRPMRARNERRDRPVPAGSGHAVLDGREAGARHRGRAAQQLGPRELVAAIGS